MRAAWLPDLGACLAVQAAMPPGWIAVTRDGSAIVTDVGVTFGAGESVLERRAEAARLTREVETLDAEVGNLRAVAVRMATVAKATADAVEAARAEESRTESARRAAEEAERLVARQARNGRPRGLLARGTVRAARRRAGPRSSGGGGARRQRPRGERGHGRDAT